MKLVPFDVCANRKLFWVVASAKENRAAKAKNNDDGREGTNEVKGKVDFLRSFKNRKKPVSCWNFTRTHKSMMALDDHWTEKRKSLHWMPKVYSSSSSLDQLMQTESLLHLPRFILINKRPVNFLIRRLVKLAWKKMILLSMLSINKDFLPRTA